MSSGAVIARDPNVRQREASDPGASVWVAASAGSGKTKVLTDRVLRQMLAGTPPARILCLTFTKAAAAEMAIRINRTLGDWATIEDDTLEDALAALTGGRPTAETCRDARRLFARVIDCPGGMKLQTIHAFCQSLLRRFPIEAGLAPHFEVMDEATATELLDQARGTVLNLARSAPGGELGQALARLTADLQEDALGALMKELAGERGRIRRILDAHGGRERTIAEVRRLLAVTPGETEQGIAEAACADSALDLDGLRRACRALSTGSATDQERGQGVAKWLVASAHDRLAGFADYATAFLTKEALPRKTLITKKAASTDPAAQEALTTEAERLERSLKRRKGAGVAEATGALLIFADHLLLAYGTLKGSRALLDYDDLILAARDLLTREGIAPWVLFKLDGGLDHILIDEAQDTNPEQWQVIERLAEEFFTGEADGGERLGTVRTVFAVGDEKQSIFSFQRADPREFARLREHFRARVTAAGRRWQLVLLDISFRSTAAVLRAVDGVFAQDAARDGVAFDPGVAIQHFSHRRGQGGVVEVWPLIRPEEAPEQVPWQAPTVREVDDQPSSRLATIIATTIAGWLDQGELLQSKGRPVRPGDILVLVRRRVSFVAELVRALKERGVPVAGVDRMVLTRQISVTDMIALAEFLLLREDDLRLAEVLKGPFIGLDEEELFSLAFGRAGSLWQALVDRGSADGPGGRYGLAHGWLSELLAGADFTPPYEFFAGVLHRPCPGNEVSGLRAMLGRLGAEARDPLDEFLNATLAFQRGHAPSLQAFLHWLISATTEIKREQEQGGPEGGVVRIMTVHGAKGLQAPIVFLPDTVSKPAQSARVLWPEDGRTVPLYAPRRGQEEAHCTSARAAADQRRDQEYRRLLYVALTRAEDRLYVCGWLAKNKTEAAEGSWYALTHAALAADPTAAPFGVGWAGGGGPGIRLLEPQTAPVGTAAATAAVPEFAPLPAWARASAPEEPEPSRPLTPSRPDEEEPAVRSPLGSDDGRRFRRGILLHRLFETLPDLSPDVREAAARRFLSRPGHGLDTATRDMMVAEALAVLNHPEFAPLFGPGSRAEVPVVGAVGGRVLSGQIDRLLVRAGEVWIVDYKTNRPPPETVAGVASGYLRQMAYYRKAVRLIYPNHRVRCLLLWTDAPRLMELPEAMLEDG